MTKDVDVGRLMSGSVAARVEIDDFGAFYERTYQMAYRTALGIVRDAGLAADVTQEAYIAAYRHRDHFRGDAPSAGWLHRIVVNQALGALRRRRPTSTVTDISASMAPDETSGTVARLALLQALDALPGRHRAAVILRYYHDYDYATIAQILETSPTNVGAMLSRALDRLNIALRPDEGPADGASAER